MQAKNTSKHRGDSVVKLKQRLRLGIDWFIIIIIIIIVIIIIIIIVIIIIK